MSAAVLHEASDVVVLSGEGSNDAINGHMREISKLFGGTGYAIRFYDMKRIAPEELQGLARLLAGGSVAFGLSFLGIGQELELRLEGAPAPVSAWDHFGIPLIKLHGDTPAYYLDRHRDVPLTAVNAYYFEEHLAFRRWMLPDSRAMGALVQPYIASDTPLAAVDFERRKRGTLVFVKNGGDPQALMALWAQKLPETVSDQLIDLALAIEKPALRTGRFLIHEFVIDALEAAHVDAQAMRPLVRLYVAQLDDYVRRVKSTLIARALLPFPVVIQGAGWDHVDFAKARAKHAPPLDFAETEAVFRNELGVIDMSPNIDGGAHDRLFRAAGTYAYALTNKSSWLERVCPELNARAFEFEEGSIAASAERALANPGECVAIARTFGEAYRRQYTASAWVDRITALADMSRTMAHEFPVQPYFVW